MMQEWANIVDAWIAGQKYAPTLYPAAMDFSQRRLTFDGAHTPGQLPACPIVYDRLRDVIRIERRPKKIP
jgi:hypothetical protein